MLNYTALIFHFYWYVLFSSCLTGEDKTILFEFGLEMFYVLIHLSNSTEHLAEEQSKKSLEESRPGGESGFGWDINLGNLPQTSHNQLWNEARREQTKLDPGIAGGEAPRWKWSAVGLSWGDPERIVCNWVRWRTFGWRPCAPKRSKGPKSRWNQVIN